MAEPALHAPLAECPTAKNRHFVLPSYETRADKRCLGQTRRLMLTSAASALPIHPYGDELSPSAEQIARRSARRGRHQQTGH